MRRGILALVCGLIAVCGLVAITFIGRGDAGSGIPVSGSVTRDGQPIQEATISFIPAKGTSGPAVGAAITKGRYRIRPSEGLEPGRYTVRVSLGDVPSRADIMGPPSKRKAKPGKPVEFEREVTRDNPQINIEL